MALELTQPLLKMSTRNTLGGKGDRCVRLTTSPPSRTECHEIWESKPPGTLWVTPGLFRDTFTFTFLYVFCLNILFYDKFRVIYYSCKRKNLIYEFTSLTQPTLQYYAAVLKVSFSTSN
jgi:hypothetical protein